jgi:hypothetical protein
MNALFTYVTLFILDGFTYDKLRYLWYEKDPVIVLHDNLPLYDTPERPPSSTQMCHYKYFHDGKVYLLF